MPAGTHAVLCGSKDSIHPNPTAANGAAFLEWCWIASAAVSSNFAADKDGSCNTQSVQSLSTVTHSSPKRAGGCGKRFILQVCGVS